jgi:hypothetical protein
LLFITIVTILYIMKLNGNMSVNKTKSVLLLVCMVLFTCVMCTIPGPVPGPESAPVVQYNYSPDERVYMVPFESHPYLKIEVTGDYSPGLELLMAKMNLSSSPVSASKSGTMISYSNDITGKSTRNNPEISSGVRQDFAVATSFNSNPPPFVEEYRGTRSVSWTYGNPDTDLTLDVTTRQFWVADTHTDGSMSWYTITARLVAITRYMYIWIDENRLDDGSLVDDDNLVTMSQVQKLGEVFDGSDDLSWKDGIFHLATNVFGYENGGGPEGDGGVDADQHISILIYDIDSDEVVDSGVVGYFWAKDLYSDSSLPPGWRSNRAEMFYIDAHFLDSLPGFTESTLAHEFQHMINFNGKFLEKGIVVSTWYNEMLSMLCEDLVTSYLNLADPTEDSPRSRLTRFNSGYYLSGVSDWLSGSDVLYSYAGAYTFGAFLARNYGGAPFISRMSNNSLPDIASINEAMNYMGSGDTFSNAFYDFGQTLLLGDGTYPGIKTFSSLDSTVDTTGYTLAGFDLDNIEQKFNPAISGPFLFNPEDQATLRPYGITLHSFGAWDPVDGETTIVLKKPADTVSFFLMVR